MGCEWGVAGGAWSLVVMVKGSGGHGGGVRGGGVQRGSVKGGGVHLEVCIGRCEWGMWAWECVGGRHLQGKCGEFLSPHAHGARHEASATRGRRE